MVGTLKLKPLLAAPSALEEGTAPAMSGDGTKKYGIATAGTPPCVCPAGMRKFKPFRPTENSNVKH